MMPLAGDFRGDLCGDLRGDLCGDFFGDGLRRVGRFDFEKFTYSGVAERSASIFSTSHERFSSMSRKRSACTSH